MSDAMHEVTCRRCGQSKVALLEPPLPGRWGAVVQRESCGDCWRDWVEEQTRLINHERLQPASPSDRARLYERMRVFLGLTS